MTLDPAALSRLLSLSVFDSTGNQGSVFSDSATAGSDTENNFSTLLSLILALQNRGSMPAASAPASQTPGTGDNTESLWNQLSSPPAAQNFNGLTMAGYKASATPQYSGNALSEPVGKTTTDYEGMIQAAGRKYGVNPKLIASVIAAESGGNASAVSSSGALGLMQLMPATASALGVGNALDPAQNIDGGTKYLGRLLQRYNGKTDLALAAYNAGSGNVSRYGGVPPFPETQAYVSRIMNSIGNDIA
jgi:Soluble lytic murein transglycosylase and related regulatory proteins (some contain LysM/invasin domains)